MKRLSVGLFVAVFALGLSPLCFANDYWWGNERCPDFNYAKRGYENDPESLAFAMGYGRCLVIKGRAEGNLEEELRGLNMLNHFVENEPIAYTAFFLARYSESGGEFGSSIDAEKIDESIEAWFRVLQIINNDPYYPRNNGDEFDEFNFQIELRSSYSVPMLYMHRFLSGLLGSHNWALLNSPSHEGDEDLNTYTQYSPYTLDSLKEALGYADECLNLPHKDHMGYWEYPAYQQACQLIKDTASVLYPLEIKRLELLADESCGGDLPQCEEYLELAVEIMVKDIYTSMDDSLGDIFQRMRENLNPDS